MNALLVVLAIAILVIAVIVVRRLMAHLTESFDDTAWLDSDPWVSADQTSDVEVKVSASVRARAILAPAAQVAFDVLISSALLFTIAVDIRTHAVTAWTYVSWALVVVLLAHGVVWSGGVLRLARRLRHGRVLFATRDDGIQFGDLIIPWSSMSRVGANVATGNVYVRYASSADEGRPIACRITRATDGSERLLVCEKMSRIVGKAASRTIVKAIADGASRNSIRVRALTSIRDDVTFTWMTDPSLPADRFRVE